jgi:hypothetical protein
MAQHHTAGTLVWVSDAQSGWTKGEVIKLEGGQLRVRTEQGSVGMYKADDCPLQNPMSRMGVEVGPIYSHNANALTWITFVVRQQSM